MNIRTTYKILDFLKAEGIDALDIEEVDMDFQTETLDIIYLPRPSGIPKSHELGSSVAITRFLEYLTNE